MKHVWMYAAALAAAMVGCSDKDTDGVGGTQEIRVGAKVIGAVETRAPVTTGSSFMAAIAAFEGSSDPADWTAVPAWTNSVTLTAQEQATGNLVPLNVMKVYPQTGNVYMAAWHPNILSLNGVVTFGRTGTEDVMYGGIVSGSSTVPVGAFSFTHALTQLNFQVQATAQYLTDNPDKQITGIDVIAAAYPQSMQIGTGILTYTAPADLPVPGLLPVNLTSSLVSAGVPFMVEALDGVSIRVHYSDNTNSDVIPIINAATNTPLDAEAGKLHLITLTFQKTGEVGIQGSATVAPWEIGASGNGSIVD